jgi:hypothetical protein
MKWQVGRGGWLVGQWLIPAGTIVSGVAGPDGELVEAPQWHGVTLPVDSVRPMPINAAALDEEAALLMLRWYQNYGGLHLWHRLRFGPGIDRDAIKTRARELASKHG